jgi:hypothetical protein
MIDGAAARARVLWLRRTLTLHGAWIFPVILAEAAMTAADGKFQWAAFWAALLVATFALWLAGVMRERRRDRIILEGSDDAVRAYVAARLTTSAAAVAKLGPWLVVGGAFLAIGVVDIVRTDRPSMLHAAENLLLGLYFVGSRLYARFVLAPALVRLREDMGEPPADVGPLLAERVRAVAAAMGEVQAMMFWRETTGASIGDSKAAVQALLRGASAPTQAS